MDFNWIWETFAIFLLGKLILKLGGRKSISQITITQAIVMVGIGSLLIQPLNKYDIWTVLIIALWFVILMVISEYIEIKFDALETFFSGKAVIVIQDGKPDMKNLKKLRLSLDHLETRLRQNGVSSIEDVKTATIEVSGQIGYELKEDKMPLTKGDFLVLMAEIYDLKKLMEGNNKTQEIKQNTHNIFDEIINKDHEGNKNEP